MPKAYSYTRFSTPEQRRGDSAARQSRLTREYLQHHPELELDESLKLSDLGVSAFDKSNLAKGAALRGFLDAVERGVVTPGSYLLVESLDRLSRAQVMDALQLFTKILEKDITIVTLADGMVYSKEKANRQSTDLMMSLLIMSRAHEESLSKSRRVGAAWEAKRANLHQKKLTRTCPSWLELTPDKSEYRFIKRKVAVVREAVDLLLSGVGKDAIAKRFNQRGTPSIGNKRERQTWYGSYVTKILRNRSLIGEFQLHKMVNGKRVPHGSPIQDYFPRVLSDEQFALVQHVIDERGKKWGGRRGKSFPNLFTGLVRCGYCGSTMIYVNKGPQRNTRRPLSQTIFLACHNAKRGVGCHYVPWSYSEIENGILNYARGLDFAGFLKTGEDRDASIRAISEEIIIARSKLSDTISRRDKLLEALETVSATPIEVPSVVMERITSRQKEVADLEELLNQLRLKAKAVEGHAHVSAESVDAIERLLIQLSSKSGEELFLLRARLNEHMRHLLSHIHLFAGGMIVSPNEAKSLREELLSSGKYTTEEIDLDLPLIAPTSPNKQHRFLVLMRRSGAIQVLRPQEQFPDVFAALRETPTLVKKWLERRANDAQEK